MIARRTILVFVGVMLLFSFSQAADPNPFDLVYPFDDYTSPFPDVPLGWDAAVDPDGDDVFYDVYVSTNVDPTTVPAVATGLTSPYFLFEGGVSGSVYYWTVEAYDAGLTPVGANQVWSFSVDSPDFSVVYPGWSMFSVPLYPDDPTTSVVLGDDIDEFYQVFGFNYTQGWFQPEELELGVGYWLQIVNPGEASWNLTVTGTAEVNPFDIELEFFGWNFIGTPFDFPVLLSDVDVTHDGVVYDWADAVAHGIVHDAVYTLRIYWEGWNTYGFYATDRLVPFGGYYMLPLVDDVEITIPPIAAPIAPDADSELDDVATDHWTLEMNVVSGNTIHARPALGVRSAATTGFDAAYDVEELPGSPAEEGSVEASFLRGERSLYRDLVGEIAMDGQAQWELVVTADTAGELTLLWPDQHRTVPEGYSITLQDVATGQTVDMRDVISHSFQHQSGERSFLVTVAANATDVGEGVVGQPERFALESAYPNPFNAMTTLRYSLVQSGQVELAVYNTAGRRVAELASGTRQAGAHQVSWDAQGLSTGMYFVHLRSGGQSDMLKVMLIK